LGDDWVARIGVFAIVRRMGASLVALGIGLMVFVAAAALLFWNEGDTARLANSLQDGDGRVQDVEATRVDPANEGKLVYLSGQALAAEPARDPEVGVTAQALRLSRKVRIYQWKETEHVRGKTVRSYSYAKVWTDEPIDASRFSRPAGHQNPTHLAFGARTFDAVGAHVGAFALSPKLRDQMKGWQPLTVKKASLKGLPAELMARLKDGDRGLFLGQSPQHPAVGDLQISYEIVPPAQVSVVARQTGQGLGPFHSRGGSDIEMLSMGAVPRTEMFKEADFGNKGAAWVIRFLGYLLMLVATALMLRPVVAAADLVPFFGALVNRGVLGVALVLSALMSTLVIALAWLVYKPVASLGMLVVVGACAFVWLRRGRPPHGRQPHGLAP
jgi:hypothetical protein